VVAEDDLDAIKKAKELLAFLPSNNREPAPRIANSDDPWRKCPELDTIIPDKPNQPYDMKKVISAIVDNGYFFETLKDHAKSVITGFARFDGRPVGIWANQPMFASGTIDINFDPTGFEIDSDLLVRLDPLYHYTLTAAREAFRALNYGYACALGLVVLGLILAVSLIVFRYRERGWRY